MDERNLAQTMEDLAEDFAALDALAASGEERLLAFREQLKNHPTFFAKETARMIEEELIAPLAAYADIRKRLKASSGHHLEIIARKKSVIDELRALQGIGAGIIASMDWQSPSYAHAAAPQAGRRTGSIVGTQNDYTRDHHAEAAAYERAFAREYIDTGLHLPLRAYAMASGMAAFSTIVASLQPDVAAQEQIVAGSAVYFENKKVLRQLFGERVVWTPETDAAAFVETVARVQPPVIVLDSLCNTETMEAPDLERLIPALGRAVRRPTTLILDNTTLSLTSQPFRWLPHFSKLRLIVFESLNKYHQFGFDRVTGGIAWTGGFTPDRLFETRMHFGTNIPEASALALPEPNAKWLKRRIARLGRNAQWLAEALQRDLDAMPRSPLSHVVYPGLPSHPSHAWMKDNAFRGSFFVMRFKPNHARVSAYESFIAAVMREAKNAGVDLNAGTSFGFDATRIYLTARHAERDAIPFVRVSAGTESQWELERLRAIFTKAMAKL